MFIGHNAVAFASKPAAPRVSLGTLTAAAMFPDLIWPIFLLLGLEHVRIEPGATKFTPLDFNDYPWTHSLATTAAWAAAFALIYRATRRDARGAVMVAIGVISHWLLDFATHRPDLPLWPGGPRAGLGLWNYPAATMAIESAMFIMAVLLYRRFTRPRDRAGSIGFWAFVILIAAIYIVTATGPAPPNVTVVAWMGLSGWLLPFWAGWFDRHREAAV